MVNRCVNIRVVSSCLLHTIFNQLRSRNNSNQIKARGISFHHRFHFHRLDRLKSCQIVGKMSIEWLKESTVIQNDLDPDWFEYWLGRFAVQWLNAFRLGGPGPAMEISSDWLIPLTSMVLSRNTRSWCAVLFLPLLPTVIQYASTSNLFALLNGFIRVHWLKLTRVRLTDLVAKCRRLFLKREEKMKKREEKKRTNERWKERRKRRRRIEGKSRKFVGSLEIWLIGVDMGRAVVGLVYWRLPKGKKSRRA